MIIMDRSQVPTNDIWIAAHAMETGAELLSYDQHFSNVEGLVWTRLVRPETSHT